MRDETRKAVALLRELGLNQLEAEVYAFMLSNEPATAYGIGKALGRPTANVYKAIERLELIGAVLVEEGSTRRCRAVPVGELIRHVERRFLETSRAAHEALVALERPSCDEGVYRISSVAEVMEKGREMLERAGEVVVADMFPRALEAMTPSLEAAAHRGVEVVVEAYGQAEIQGADVVTVPDGARSVRAWRCEQLNLVVDGREHLLALLSEDLDEVYQAVWSSSVYLSCLHHSGRMSEITIIRLMNQLETGSGGRLEQTLRRHPFFRDSVVPGHQELVRRFARPRQETQE
jgi:sugar-specific transcriptional regulator TrmB